LLALLARRGFGQCAQLLPDFSMQSLGQFVEDVQHAVVPTSLVTRGGKDFVEGCPEPQGAVADRQQRRFHQATLLE